MPARSFRRFARSPGSSQLTVTLSKKASSGARSRASAAMAPAKSSRPLEIWISLPARASPAWSAFSSLGSEKCLVDAAVVSCLVLPLLDAHDVGGPPVGGEQIGAVVAGKECAERLHAREQAHEVVFAARCEDRRDEIVPYAFLAQMHLEALGEEGEEVGGVEFAGVGGTCRLLAIEPLSRCKCLGERQAQAVLDDEPDDAQGRAPQGIGILGARRLLVDRPEADERVDLVGKRHGERDGCARAAVVGAERRVMLGDGLGHRRRLALVERVIAPHDALQLGELADHAGHEVGLGEEGGTARAAHLAAGDVGRELGGERLEARHLVAHAAEPGMEDEGRKLGHALLELDLAVLVPEELGVRQARAQHPLVARGDRPAAVRGRDVGHDDEVLCQAAVLRLEREILLVRAHGGDEHLARQRHEGAVDRSNEGNRPLDEARHLVEQRRVLLERQPLGRRELGGAGDDDALALLAVEDDEASAELIPVVGEACDREWLGCEETVAARLVGEGKRGIAEIEGTLERPPVEHRKHGVERTDPAERARARAHRPLPREVANDARDDIANDLRRRPSGHLAHREMELGIADRAHLALGERGQSRRLEEALDRLLGRAQTRTLALLEEIRLPFRQAVHDERQPPRRHMRLRVAEREAGLIEFFRHQALEVVRRARLHARRNLFGVEL